MVLYTEHMIFDHPHTFHSVIQKVYVGNLQTGTGKTLGIYRIGVVLRGDFHLSGLQILHRMVAATMTEFQLIGFGAIGQRNNLMSQTNTENRIFSPELTYQLDYRKGILRISGAVGEENAIGLQCFYGFRCAVPGENRYITSQTIQAADNVVLDAAVNGDHMKASFLRRRLPGGFCADLRYLIPG